MQTTESSESVRVILTGIEDPSAEGVDRFARDLAQTFKIPIEKALAIATDHPFTVKQSCDPEVAQRLAHTLGRLGGIYRIEPVAAVRPPALATAAPPGTSNPAGGPTGAERGMGSLATIPLARPAPETSAPAEARPAPSPAADSSVAPAAGVVVCRECGNSQPAGRKACSNCYFPLPTTPVGQLRDSAAQRPVPAKPIVISNLADGYGDLQQAAPAVLTAAGLLFATAFINLWTVAFLSQIAGPAGFVSSLIDIGLGIGLLKGSSTARTWILLRAVLGGVLLGIVALGTGDAGWFLMQELYSVSLIILLTGKGSLLKAVLVGVPNAAILALAVVGLALMSMGGDFIRTARVQTKVMEAEHLRQNGRYDQAIRSYREALDASSPEADQEIQARAYLGLGSSYIGLEDFVHAIPELQASVALRDDSSEAHYLLGRSYFEVGQDEEALAELHRVRELDPNYPGLDDSIRTVSQTMGHRY